MIERLLAGVAVGAAVLAAPTLVHADVSGGTVVATPSTVEQGQLSTITATFTVTGTGTDVADIGMFTPGGVFTAVSSSPALTCTLGNPPAVQVTCSGSPSIAAGEYTVTATLDTATVAPDTGLAIGSYWAPQFVEPIGVAFGSLTVVAAEATTTLETTTTTEPQPTTSAELPATTAAPSETTTTTTPSPTTSTLSTELPATGSTGSRNLVIIASVVSLAGVLLVLRARRPA